MAKKKEKGPYVEYDDEGEAVPMIDIERNVISPDGNEEKWVALRVPKAAYDKQMALDPSRRNPHWKKIRLPATTKAEPAVA